MNNRPKVEISWEPIDLISELINLLLLLSMWGFVIYHYQSLPDTIPVHFNAAGEADDYGGKMTIIILPAIATLTYLLIFFLGKYPHLHNYMVNITEENAERNYRLSTRLLRYVNMFCLIIIGVLVFEVINLANGSKAVFLKSGFLIFSIVAPLIMIIVAFRLSKKINQ